MRQTDPLEGNPTEQLLESSRIAMSVALSGLELSQESLRQSVQKIARSFAAIQRSDRLIQTSHRVLRRSEVAGDIAGGGSRVG